MATRASVCVAKRCRASSSHSSVAKNDAAIALSEASPREPIDGRTPNVLQRCPNARAPYCDP